VLTGEDADIRIDGNPPRQLVVHCQRISPEDLTMSDLIVFFGGLPLRYDERLAALG